MHRHSWTFVGILGASFAAGVIGNACSASDAGNSGSGNASSTSAQGGAGGTGVTSTATGQGGIDISSSAGGMSGCNQGAQDDDLDKDGFTPAQGDCNDCDPNINPGAVEVIAEPDADGGVPLPADEDCDGMIDNVAPPCDGMGLAIDDLDPMDAAKAIGACKYVTKASWVLADGSPPPVDATLLANFHIGHGILPDLGPNNKPQEGDVMLMLSSGTARL